MVIAGAMAALEHFANRLDIPVATSISGPGPSLRVEPNLIKKKKK